MAVAPLLDRVRGFDGPAVGNRDFATPVGGRWCTIDPESNAPDLVNFESSAPDLVNFEYAHQALVLQSMIDAPHQTDHARDKIPDRTKPLMACIAQAADKNGFYITTNYIADVAVGYQDEEGDAKTSGRLVCNSYYIEVPDRGWLGMDGPMAHECPNLHRPLSTTGYLPGLSTATDGEDDADDDDGPDPDGIDATNRHCVGIMGDQNGNRIPGPRTETPTSFSQLLG
jgi:hypothetical protein